MKLAPSAVVLALVAAAVGCGDETTNVAERVDRVNQSFLAGFNAKMSCPDEVSGGEGATFQCTLRSKKAGRTAPVTMRLVERDGETIVDFGDPGQFSQALKQVSGR